MKNEMQRNNTLLTIPLKVVTGIIIGLLIALILYIYSNYTIDVSL
ncbi:hypothetical protein ACUXI4_003252 [Pantoea piersonii]|jgi:hypothetical protein